mgnify:CR=1 FL=1
MREVALLVVLSISSLAMGGPQAACPIVPLPKVYRETGRSVQLLGPEAVAIVIGRRSTGPERYAAEQFQARLERRFRRRLPIVAEQAVDASVRQVFLLGQRNSNDWLDRLCGANKIELSATAPGENGFVIEAVDDGPP